MLMLVMVEGNLTRSYLKTGSIAYHHPTITTVIIIININIITVIIIITINNIITHLPVVANPPSSHYPHDVVSAATTPLSRKA